MLSIEARVLARIVVAKSSPILSIADAAKAKIENAVNYAFAKGRKAVNKSALKKATTRGAALAATSRVPAAVEAALKDVLPPFFMPLLEQGGNLALSKIRATRAVSKRAARFRVGATLRRKFDVRSDDAINWVHEHGAELVEGIADTTRDRIRNAILFAETKGDWTDAYDAILDAVGSASRADMIARTETMTAANEGQRQGWLQAKDDELLSNSARRVWITTPGCCDDCDDLDGATATLDGEYPDPGEDGPPLHPNCRCTEGIQ